jgi:molecular chaperone DnaK
MGAIVGIDLGTTNSCVAVVKDGRPRVIEDERGYNILPSCIAMKSRGRFIVGHGAKALILTHPKDTLYAIKRLIGRKSSAPEVSEVLRHVAYDVVQGERGEVLLRLGDIEITPVEASSIILKAVKEIAEKALGEQVTDAVITVPANFNHSQRKATMEAGEKAGLNVLRLLNEPTAAALAYGFKKDIHKKIAIYDLGGGTFDISVLEIGDGVYEILGTAGNTFLGGEDFDYRIVNWLADHFRSSTGVDPRNDKEALQRLKGAGERAKCELSFVDRTPILVPRLYGEHNLEVELTREQLESMAQDLINETIKVTDQALRTANVSIEDLDEIILVGGMTRMPKIQETIRIFFGMNPCKGVHPEEVVAIGAAVHGYSLESETQNTLLLDVTPFSLGIDMAGGFFRPVIERNSTVPCSESRTFTTAKDNQTEVKVVARQGESKLALENEFLGEFVLQGIRPAPKMVAKIDVTFRIDSNGIMHVTAVDRDTGDAQSIEIRDYIEQATGEESKAVTLAKEDLASPQERAEQGETSEDPQERAFFGRLAKLAGFGRKKKGKKAASVPFDADPNAIASRSDDDLAVSAREDSDLAMAARTDDDLALATRSAADAGEALAIGPDDDDFADDLRDAVADNLPTADPYAVVGRTDRNAETEYAAPEEYHAVAERKDSPAIDPAELLGLSGLDAGLVEAPSEEDVFDAFGIAPKEDSSRSPFAGKLDLGGTGALDLDDLGLDDLDPFGIEARDGDAKSPSAAAAASAAAAPAFITMPAVPEAESRPTPLPTPPPRATDPAGPRKRRPAKLRISYKKASTFVKEYSKNIKRGGTFIKTKKPLDVGRECILHLTVPGWDDPIEIHGNVVWSSKGVEVMVGQEEGMGIKYDTADDAGLVAAQQALSALTE